MVDLIERKKLDFWNFYESNLDLNLYHSIRIMTLSTTWSIRFVIHVLVHCLCFRECLGPIVGGALVYRVGFQSMTAVRLIPGIPKLV